MSQPTKCVLPENVIEQVAKTQYQKAINETEEIRLRGRILIIRQSLSPISPAGTKKS